MKLPSGYWKQRALAAEKALEDCGEGIMKAPRNMSLQEAVTPFLSRLCQAIEKVDPDFMVSVEERYLKTELRKIEAKRMKRIEARTNSTEA